MRNDERADSGRLDKQLVVEQMLKELQQTMEGGVTIANIVCEFIDRANRGEPVDKEELLKQVPSQMKEELAVELDFSEALSDLGEP